MQTFDAIRARRNVRAFSDREISLSDLEMILEAGRIAPSAANGQPWDFVVCTDRSDLNVLASTWQYAGHVANAAVVVVLVVPKTDNDQVRTVNAFDVGQATMSMLVAAADLGIGGCVVGIGELAVVSDLLGVPDDKVCLYMFSLGYPSDRPIEPLAKFNRRPFDAVFHRGHW